MNTRIVGLTCALCLAAAACGGSDPKPAAEPVQTTVAPADTTTPTNSSMTTSSPGWVAPNPASQPATDRANALAPHPNAQPTVVPDPHANNAQNTNPTPTTATTPAQPATTTPNADNTKMNERDRHSTLTPVDQGGSEAERSITATIRRGVVGDSSLSFTAKNVKIITTGSKVTLRGPVNSAAEKANIEQRARQTAGVTDVDNQLEVKK